ncbi:MAG: hypothetical protein JWP01_954 [Myxococcales bacterium]|nr:hypothetical protein [Myxococcales bacterium]
MFSRYCQRPMDHDPRKRLDTALDGAHGRPFGDVNGIERALGRAVPATVKHLWSSFGEGTIPSSRIDLYDADLVLDLLEQYSDAGLTDLLPLASDGGSRDFAVDLVGRDGLPMGTIVLLDRGTMTEGSLQPVAADAIELVELARTDKLDLDGSDLATRWTEKKHAAAYATPIASLQGLGPDDYEIVALHHATLVPARLLARRDLEIAGVPCAAGEDVHLDRKGRVTYARLARDHRAGDVECLGGSLLVLGADGRLRRFTPVSDLVIEGLRWKGGVEITLPDDHLDVLWGALAEPTTIGGIPCAAGLVRLDGDRAVTEATLARDVVIDGVALPAGTWFELTSGGLYAVRLPVATMIRGRTLDAGTKHLVYKDA